MMRSQLMRLQLSDAALFLLPTLCVLAVCAVGVGVLRSCAQGSGQGPMEAPADHHVTRIGTEPEPPAPPSLPPGEIIRRFSAKEDEYLRTRPNYSFRKSVRIQEFGPDGNPSGEYLRVTDYRKSADGRIAVKSVENPQSTLQGIYLAPEDLEALDRIPAFPLTSGQLSKYDLKYIGREMVDELDCYIFQAKPKTVERANAYFDGIVWVDAQYLEVVKTYGKWVTDQGDTHAIGQLPFSLFEIYRENVDGKYWFPTYLRSDNALRVKDAEIPIRVVVKWTDFKPASTDSATPSPVATPPSAAPPPNAPSAKP
jgi:hypothetical protein